MGKNRVRRSSNIALSPHYTTGLGDGHVESDRPGIVTESTNNNNNNSNNNDDEAIVQKVIKARKWNRNNRQQQGTKITPTSDKTEDSLYIKENIVTVMFPNTGTGSTTTDTTTTGSRSRLYNNNSNNNEQQILPASGIRYIRGGSRPTTISSNRIETSLMNGLLYSTYHHPLLIDMNSDPYVEAAPILYFVCAAVIVIVSAVVVHLITIGGSSSTSSSGSSTAHSSNIDGRHHHHITDQSRATVPNKKQKKVVNTRYSRIDKKKKYDDDWNDDATDDDVLSDSARGIGSNNVAGPGTKITTICGTGDVITNGGTTSIISGLSDIESTTNNVPVLLEDASVIIHPFQNSISNNSSRLYRPRKTSMTATLSTAGVASNTVAIPLHSQAPQQQYLQSSDHTSSSINPKDAHRIFYDTNLSGAASKSPKVQHYGTTYTTIHHRSIGYCPPSPIPIPLSNNNNNDITGIQQLSVVLDHPIHDNFPIVASRSSDSQSQQHHRRSNARQLSACKSSFDSLTRTDTSVTDNDDEIINTNTSNNNNDGKLDDVEIGLWDSPTPKNNNDARYSIGQGNDSSMSSIKIPSINQSSQHEIIAVTPKMGQQRHKQSLPHHHHQPQHSFEYTPRVNNGARNRFPLHQPVPEDSPLVNVDESTNSNMVMPYDPLMPSMPPPPPIVMGSNASLNVDLAFATSPKLREQQQQRIVRMTNNIQDLATVDAQNMKSPEPQQRNLSQNPQPSHLYRSNKEAVSDSPIMAMPFVPNLSAANRAPPKSENLDQGNVLMGSDNIILWEGFVADETRKLQDTLFPTGSVVSNNNIRDSVLRASCDTNSNSSNCQVPIPSNHARIQHKRPDLTDFTDAATSLQGSIDFDELKLVEVIGGGGFGQVWKASWQGTPVAVKVLTGSAQSKSVPRPVLEEFAAEINLLKGMRHPNICLYMGACLKPPNRAIITELAENGSLWDALRLPLTPPYVPCDGLTRTGWPDYLYDPDVRYGAPPISSAVQKHLTIPIPPKGTWHWALVKHVALGAARGLCYLHGGKIPVLHRDLKSANILLDESYKAKVCDFGLSRLKAKERSMTGNCGTVQWMAPEVLANQSYNEKADIYSYGVILWELLSRQCPYDKLSPIQCALAVLNRNQRPEIPKWCPPSFHALIRSCWKKDPDERPTFPEILATLESIPQ